MVEELRAPATGTLMTSASGSSADGQDRAGPNRIRIRGWAPFGSSNEERIRRDEYNLHVKTLKDMMPTHLQALIRFETPYATNHQILARVQGGGEKCWMAQ